MSPCVQISVVMPVYRCEGSLQELHRRLTETLRRLGVTYELVFIDDRSPGEDWAILQRLAMIDPHVHAFRLSRNFGQQAAITAGLAQAVGKWVVVMDADLEDPPEEIPRLYELAQTGYEIVYGKRRVRQHSPLRRLCSNLYFKLLGMLTQCYIDSDYGTFTLLSRKVVNAFLTVGDVDRHYLLILHWLGYSSAVLEYDRHGRLHGRSAYSMISLVTHAFSGLFFQTTLLLRWIVYLGFMISGCGVALAAAYTYRYYAYNVFPLGWTTLVVLQLLLAGFIIMSTGVSALYIGKVFQQVKARPLFVIAETAHEESRGRHLVCDELPHRPSEIDDARLSLRA